MKKKYVFSLLFSSLLNTLCCNASTSDITSNNKNNAMMEPSSGDQVNSILEKNTINDSTILKNVVFRDYKEATNEFITIYKDLMSQNYTLVNECIFEECGNSIELANNINSINFISDKNKQRVATFKKENNFQLIHLSSYEDKSFLFISKNNSTEEILTSKQDIKPLTSIYFDLNSHKITERYYKNLNSIIENSNGETNIIITGHTDNSGDYELNMQLSLKRAEAVANYFINNGINSSKITVEAMGSLLPITSDDSINRRVEIHLNL